MLSPFFLILHSFIMFQCNFHVDCEVYVFCFPMLFIFPSKVLKIKILPERRHTLALDQASLGEPRWWRTWVMTILHKLVKSRVWPWFLFSINPPGAATKFCTPCPPTTSTANTTTLIKKCIFRTLTYPSFQQIYVVYKYVCFFIISASPDVQKISEWGFSDHLHYSITLAWCFKLSWISQGRYYKRAAS